jgi:hypothetical protein
MIEFRWVAIITLWTMLIGPVCDMPVSTPNATSAKSPLAKNAPAALALGKHSGTRQSTGFHDCSGTR